MALGGDGNGISGVGSGVPPTTPTLRVVEKNPDGTATTPTANNVFSLRNASVGPKTIPTLGIELNKLFENLSDPRFNKIQTLLPEEPLFPQNLDLLEGTKFYTDDAIVTKRKDLLSFEEKGLEDVKAQISTGEKYVDLEKPKLTVVLPSRFLSSPMEGLSALDWVAASINHLTKDWKEIDKPFAIDVNIEGDKRNPILTEVALDKLVLTKEKYPTGLTYTLVRPSGTNGFKAGLLLEATTESDFDRIPKTSQTAPLRRVLEKTKLTGENLYADEFGDLNMTMSPFITSNGIFHLSEGPFKMDSPGLLKSGYLNNANRSGLFFDYYDLHDQNGGVLIHQAFPHAKPMRSRHDGSVVFANPISPLNMALLEMVSAAGDTRSDGGKGINFNNRRCFESKDVGAFLKAIALSQLVNHLHDPVLWPEGRTIMPDKLTEKVRKAQKSS